MDICLPHHLHAQAALAAADAGKHVLVEKPMANTLEEAAAMVEACRRAGVKLMVGHIYRFQTVHRLVKRAIDAGLVGQVNYLALTNLVYKDVLAQAEAEGSDWKLRPQVAGGGSLHRDGVHDLDLLRWFAGEEVNRVYAETGTFLWDVPIEIAAHVTLRFRSGAMGLFQQLWCLRGPRVHETLVNGSDGSIRVRTAGIPFRSTAEVEVHSSRLPGLPALDEELGLAQPQWGISEFTGQSLLIRVPVEGNFDRQQRAFARAILDDRKPATSGAEGSRALELVVAAYRSAARREAVTLPLVTLVGSDG